MITNFAQKFSLLEVSFICNLTFIPLASTVAVKKSEETFRRGFLNQPNGFFFYDSDSLAQIMPYCTSTAMQKSYNASIPTMHCSYTFSSNQTTFFCTTKIIIGQLIKLFLFSQKVKKNLMASAGNFLPKLKFFQ